MFAPGCNVPRFAVLRDNRMDELTTLQPKTIKALLLGLSTV